MSLNICRICENTNNLKNLFSKEYGDISYKIMSCANVTIEPDDNLPQFICDQCKINLNIAYEFKKQCEFNDKKWRVLFESKEIYHDDGIEDEKYCNVSTDATGVGGNGDDDNDNDNMQNNNTIFNFEESIQPLFTTNKEISIDSNSNKKCEIYDIIEIDVLNENSIQEIINLNEYENKENQKHNELLTFYTDLIDNNKDLDKCNKIEKVSNNRNDDNNDCTIFEDYIEEEYIESEYDDDDDNNNDEYKNKNYNEHEHQMLELDDYLEICKNKSENENYDSIIEEVIDDEDGDSQPQQSSTFGIIEESSNISANKSINNENNNNYNDGATRETLPLLSSLSSVTTDNNIVLKFSKIFECDTCKEKFVSSKEFNQHKRMHGNKRYQCMKCLKWFSHRFRLKNHLQIHEENKILYKCNKCNNQYSSQGNLDRHIKHFHKNIKPYVCMECGLSFSRSHTYNIHQAVHIEEKNYECDKCRKRFKTPYYLNVHKKIHLPKELQKKKSSASSSSVNSAATKTKTKTKTKLELPVENIKCEYCSKISKSKSMHLSHIRKHSGEKPFICKYCNKAFAFRPSLRVHQFMHTGERPYKCELCNLSFRQFGHLKGHNLIHTGIKNYDCEHCGKKFAFKSNLVVHLRTHTGKTPYECNDCNQKFWDLNALKRHKNNHKTINTNEEQNELIIDETNINYYDYITT